jgi:hypothetical protein
MIGKHIANPKTRSSFRALNDYITGKSKRRLEEAGEKIAFTGCLNLVSVNTATLEMESLAFQNKRSADPVMHLLLSWRENENPTQKQVTEAVEITLKELNLSQCQAVYALHQNTDNMHLHICVNRIDPDTAKAVTPAGGWTRRAMERAARRIEHAQSWQTEANTWSYVDEAGRIVRKPKPEGISVPQKASDMENLTGEQSAIRRAQDIMKDKIKDLSGWEDFHNRLALGGMRYQRKGSGAVVFVGDIPVKASEVSRNLTLTKLEKRFGPFKEAQHLAEVIFNDASPTQSQPIPLDAANRDSANWSAYIAERKDYLKNQKKRRERLNMSQRQERESLQERHKAEREALIDSLPKGASRHIMYERRSILRTKHAYEKATLKAIHAEQRNQLKNLGDSYSSYEKWLLAHSLDDEAEKWRHRKNKQILIIKSGDAGNTGSLPTNVGILGFAMTVTKRGAVFTSLDASGNHGKEAVSFIDMGKVIKVYCKDDNSLLAALQLATQKWGGVQVNGTDEYKRRCAEIAARHGIKVANPELRAVGRKQPESPTEPVRMVPDEARKYRESWIAKTAAPRIERYGSEMAEKLKSLREAEKAAVLSLEEIRRREPEEGLFDALPILRQKYEERLKGWQRELREAERKIASARRDMENHPRDIETGRERITGEAAKGFDLLNPSITAVIRDDDVRIERERQECERRETEDRKRFHASIHEMAASYGEKVSFTTNAQEGRSYSGIMLGTAKRGGHYYAVHLSYDGHVILHSITKDEIPMIEAVKGKKVEISCRNDRIGEIREESRERERSRSWSR